MRPRFAFLLLASAAALAPLAGLAACGSTTNDPGLQLATPKDAGKPKVDAADPIVDPKPDDSGTLPDPVGAPGRVYAHTNDTLYLYEPTAGVLKKIGSFSYDKAGNLFGTTAYGGNISACNQGASPGCGTVFEITADGTEKTLYAFNGGNDGWSPVASLTEDKDGNLYGTTEAGGRTTACNGVGCGIVFKIAPDGTETVLYNFTGGDDGAHPAAGLLRDKRGNLYGTTLAGGSGSQGTAFKLSTKGSLSVLNTFTGEGAQPAGNLLAGPDKLLYGTTQFGSDGTVFQVKK